MIVELDPPPVSSERRSTYVAAAALLVCALLAVSGVQPSNVASAAASPCGPPSATSDAVVREFLSRLGSEDGEPIRACWTEGRLTEPALLLYQLAEPPVEAEVGPAHLGRDGHTLLAAHEVAVTWARAVPLRSDGKRWIVLRLAGGHWTIDEVRAPH